MKKDKKHILVLSNVNAPYRIPVYKSLSSKYEMKVIWVQKELKWNRWDPGMDDPGFSFEHGIGNIFSFIRKLKMYDAVLFVGYQPLKLLGLLLLAKLMGKKIVLMIGYKNRGYYSDGFLRKMKKNFVLKFPDMFVTYGSYVTDLLKNEFKIEKNRIITGVNIGEVSFFRSKIRLDPEKNVRRKNRKIKLVMVSRLIKNKGILQLINALKDTGEKNYKLNIYGAGPMLNRINSKLKKLEMEEKIECPGFISKEELADQFSEADIFILPTFEDAFSISSSEALASGLFSLLSIYDNASFDLIREGENGFVFDPADNNEFRDVLIKSFELVRSGKLNKRVISNSISEYTEKHYASKIEEAIEKIYSQ